MTVRPMGAEVEKFLWDRLWGGLEKSPCLGLASGKTEMGTAFWGPLPPTTHVSPASVLPLSYSRPPLWSPVLLSFPCFPYKTRIPVFSILGDLHALHVLEWTIWFYLINQLFFMCYWMPVWVILCSRSPEGSEGEGRSHLRARLVHVLE